MQETITLTGMVLLAAPSGDYDRRLVILTAERGRITAFAHKARRPGNSLMACSRTFVFGKFTLYEGRTAYNLHSAQVLNYFEDLSQDMEGACYGAYFLELAEYYSRENMEAAALLTLVYQSLRALGKPAIPNPLVRRIFELKLMEINGEYTQEPPIPVSQACCYAWQYVLSTPEQSLYQFTLTPQVLKEFQEAVETARKRFLYCRCRSLEVLGVLTGEGNCT